MSDDRPNQSRRHDSPDESVHDNAAPVQKTVIRIDASALSIIALILAVAALVFVYQESSARERLALRDQQIVDAKINAGRAEAEATAREARTNARVALDKVEDVRAKLAEKGIKIGPLDGH